MPFGDISLPPGAIQQPNIAGSFLEGALGMQRMQTSQALADDLEREAALKQRALDAENQWSAAVRANPGEQGLAALYAADPQRAAGYEKQLLELSKLRGEVGRVNAETGVKQGEMSKQDRDILGAEAVTVVHYLKALPPEQRNAQGIAPILNSRAEFWRRLGNNKIADGLVAGINNPNIIQDITATAKGIGGYKDPDEEVNRNIYQATEIERAKNALPLSPYQQAQLNQQGQQNQIQANQAQWGVADGLRKEFNALPEVGEYNAILPLSQAVRQAATQDNQAADLDMIYGVARMLDPKGVVRESDSSMIVATGSPAQQYLGLFNKIAGGGKLTPEIRKNLLQIADRREGAARSAYEARRNAFGGILQQRGVDPSMVFSEPMAVQQGGAPQAQAQPAAQGGGLSAPAPTGDASRAIAEARTLMQQYPGKADKIRNWLQMQGIDPAGL